MYYAIEDENGQMLYSGRNAESEEELFLEVETLLQDAEVNPTPDNYEQILLARGLFIVESDEKFPDWWD